MSRADTPRTTTADPPGTPDAEATGPSPAGAHTRSGTAVPAAQAPTGAVSEAGGVGRGTVMGTVGAPTAACDDGAERGGAACPGAGVGS
ncbi:MULTISPECIES: hypothetical protein [Streptomyces]|uniref:Uncharacterized protein n=1 Tax=Streptomyces griseosporeus TaxID=1910 RepID=A0ABV3KFR1_STRGS|nr:hypothetical protein [Streptomyces actuosus]MBM4822870.1 hypothetical protein [Streptomyces actuosus]